MAYALNVLNLSQQKCDLYQTIMDHFRWQLFSDWYRIFQADSNNTMTSAERAAEARYTDWSSLHKTWQTSETELAQDYHRAHVQAQHHCDWMLKAVSAPRYWQPSEPVILLKSDALGLSKRYGDDGSYTTEGHLMCRLTTQVLDTLTVNQQLVNASQFSTVSLPEPNALPHSAILNALLREACLLNTQIAAARTHILDQKVSKKPHA